MLKIIINIMKIMMMTPIILYIIAPHDLMPGVIDDILMMMLGVAACRQINTEIKDMLKEVFDENKSNPKCNRQTCAIITCNEM